MLTALPRGGVEGGTGDFLQPPSVRSQGMHGPTPGKAIVSLRQRFRCCVSTLERLVMTAFATLILLNYLSIEAFPDWLPRQPHRPHDY